MSYNMYFRLKAHRIETSKAAYEKWLAKNPSATVDDAKALYEKHREAWVANRDDEKLSKLYWWSLKVYNGALIVIENKPFWY